MHDNGLHSQSAGRLVQASARMGILCALSAGIMAKVTRKYSAIRRWTGSRSLHYVIKPARWLTTNYRPNRYGRRPGIGQEAAVHIFDILRYGQPGSHRDSRWLWRWRSWWPPSGHLRQRRPDGAGVGPGRRHPGRCPVHWSHRLGVRSRVSMDHLMPGLNIDYVRLPQISTASRRVVTKALQPPPPPSAPGERVLFGAHSAPRCR